MSIQSAEIAARRPGVEAPLSITVETHYLSGDHKVKKINYHDSSDRQWLGNHCYWCFLNGASVLTYATID